MNSHDAPSDRPKGPSLAILVAVTALGPISLNLFVPSMPGLQAAFAIDYATAQLTLSLYLAALAIAQLIVGPLSDRFGRRPALLGGTALFILASFGCAFALSIEQLILGRIVQAIGGCAGIVIARAAIRDRYDRDEAASKFGYITVAMIAVPMAAPALGGYLDEIGGWRLGFYAVSGLGILVLAMAWAGFAETHRASHDGGGGFLRLARVSGALVREPVFLGYSLAVAFSTAIFFAFLAGAPFMVTEVLGRSPSEYGIYFIFVSGGYMVGNYLSGLLSRRLSSTRMFAAGIVLLIAGLALVSLFSLFGQLSLITLFAPMALVTVSNGLVIPAGTASAISVRPDVAGSGAGIAGFLQIGMGALATGAVSLFHDGTFLPVLAVMLACGIASVLLLVYAEWANGRAAA